MSAQRGQARVELAIKRAVLLDDGAAAIHSRTPPLPGEAGADWP